MKKRNNRKVGRFVSLLLAICMILTTIWIPAYAEGSGGGLFRFSGEETVEQMSEENADASDDASVQEEDGITDDDSDGTAGTDEPATADESDVTDRPDAPGVQYIPVETDGSEKSEEPEVSGEPEYDRSLIPEGLSFASGRLLVTASAGDIAHSEYVLASYTPPTGQNAIYLLQFETQDDAKNAYSYYAARGIDVEVDAAVGIAEGDAIPAASSMDGETNPFTQLSSALDEIDGGSTAGIIALLDTGVNGNVIDSVSMLSESGRDRNGHGTRMYETILAESPDAQILSVQVLDWKGAGEISALYAGIVYAVEYGVDYIVMPLAAWLPDGSGSELLEQAVALAQSKGIILIAAAGNAGTSVQNYVPASIPGVITVGAADDSGERQSFSNYGDAVKYNVTADSTSEAAARFAGIFYRDGADALPDYETVFPADYDAAENGGNDDEENVSYIEGVVMAQSIPANGVGSYGGPNNVTGYQTANKFGTGNGKTGDWYLDSNGTLYLKGSFFAQGVSNGNRTTTWPWLSTLYSGYSCETDIKKVVIDGSLKPTANTSLGWMFWACRAVETIDLTGLETNPAGNGYVSNLTEMFRGCNKLTKIEFGDTFDVSRVTTGMSGMFWNCYSLSSMDVSNWNTSSVPTMQNMFNNCGDGSLALDLRGWTFKSGVNVQDMFTHCNMASVNLSGADLSNLQDSLGRNHYMFSPSSGVKTDGAKIGRLDLSNAEFGNISMNDMFKVTTIGTLDLTDAKTENISAIHRMFEDATIDTLNMQRFKFTKVTQIMQAPFGGAKIGKADLSGVTFGTTMENLFQNATIDTLTLEGAHTENVMATNGVANVFYNAKINSLNMRGLDLSKVNFGQTSTNMFDHGATGKIGTADLTGVKFGTRMYYIFSNAAIDNLILKGADTSNVTNMNGLFYRGVFEYINFDVDFNKDSCWIYSGLRRTSMFDKASFLKITFPAVYPQNSARANFLFGSGIGSSTYGNAPWAKIDEATGEVIEPYSYDQWYLDSTNSGTLKIVGLVNGDLGGTWIMQRQVNIQLVKVDEQGNSLEGSRFEVKGGYRNNGNANSDNETNVTVEPLIAGASVSVRLTGTYTVHETVAPEGYRAAQDFQFNVMPDGSVRLIGDPPGVAASGSNLLVYNYPTAGSLSVKKVWDDADTGAVRPGKISLKLYDANDNLVAAQTDYDVTLGESQIITFLKADNSDEELLIPRYGIDGSPIAYRVEETPVEGYVSRIDDSDPENIVITNASLLKKRDIEVTVRWKEDDADGGAARPASVEVRLMQGIYAPETDSYVYEPYDNGGDIREGVLTLSGDSYDSDEAYGEWTLPVAGLPVYDENGNEYSYVLEQALVPEYLTPLVDNESYIIVNNHKAVITWLRPGAAAPFDPSGRRLYQQQTDPDGPGDGITFADGADKLYTYVQSKYNPKDPGYFIPAKDAYWIDKNSGETEGAADILISYREAPKNVFFLGSACNSHNLDAAKLQQELTAAAGLSDLDYIIEGVNFLGRSYRYGDTSYSVAHSFLGTVPTTGSTISNGGSAPSMTLAVGAHANVLAFASDIVSRLGGLSDEMKPAQLILSFDWGAWTTCSAALENPDWRADMALMRQAAAILQEYYDAGKVVWLASDENVSGGQLKTFAQMNSVGSREWYTNYLYPDSIQDFYDDPVPVNYKDFAGKVAEDLHNAYLGGLKVTLADGRQVKPCTTNEFLNKSDGNLFVFTAPDGSTINNRDNPEKTVDFFTLSKRIPFYQFALLNPTLFLACTTDDSVTRVPGIDEWLSSYVNGRQYRATVPTAGYAEVDVVRQTMRANYQGYDTITITDTLADGLTYQSAELYYYTGDESKDVSGSWVAVDPKYYTISSDGTEVEAVLRAKDADVAGKRVMLVLHTKCDKIVFADLDNQPRETNAGDAKVVTTASNVLDDKNQPYVSKTVDIASPRLRKVLPRAQVTATKTWVDDSEESDRPDVVLRLRAKYTYIDSQTGEKKVYNTIDDILPGILITGGKSQSVTWGGYTAYEGFSVDAYIAAGGGDLAKGKVDVSESGNSLSTKYLDGGNTYDIEYEVWESAPDGSAVTGYFFETELDRAETYNDGTEFEYKVVAYKTAANVARSLTVKKIVSGNFGNKNQSFDFSITLTAPNGAEKRTVHINGGTDVNINGAEGNSFEFGGSDSPVTITCKLSHSETLRIDPLPIGTEYAVSETQASGYTTSTVHLMENEDKPPQEIKAEYNGGEVSGTLVKSANVTFENKKEGLVPTGIYDTVAPALGLIALAAILLGVVVLFLKISKGRRRKGVH